MSVSQNGWITCAEFEKKGLLPGTKVHLSECIACNVTECFSKGFVFSTFFPQWIDLDQSPLNKKIVKLNKTLSLKKRGKSPLYCPKKKQPTLQCNAKNSFCRYNLICGRYENEKKTVSDFIKSIRWRKTMIYVVMYLDGTSEVVNRNDFPAIDIDKVERVYPGNYEVKIVSELVPLGEEKEKLSETIATFNEKYKGGVVTLDGMVNFDEWFTKASNGDTAIIPEKVLVPQKTYKIQKIKDVVEVSNGKGAKKLDIIPDVEKETPVLPPAKKSPVKIKKVDDTQPSIFDSQIQNTIDNEPEKTKKNSSKKKK